MQNELLKLQHSLQKTIIFITHDFLEAIKLGDRIAIMKDGEIVQVGTSQEIVANPGNDYVREFTQDVPRAKVLTAEVIMQPIDSINTDNDVKIPCHTTLEALIPMLIGFDRSLPVVDSAGKTIGSVDQKTLLLALAEN